MALSVPHSYPEPSEQEKIEVNHSIQRHSGFIYFHRIPDPTLATVVYSTSVISRLIVEQGYHRLVVDFTGRQLVEHSLRRLMLQRMSPVLGHLTEIAIVLDGTSFRRVILDFFVRGYLRKRGIKVTFLESKKEAIEYMEAAVAKNTP